MKDRKGSRPWTRSPAVGTWLTQAQEKASRGYQTGVNLAAHLFSASTSLALPSQAPQASMCPLVQHSAFRSSAAPCRSNVSGGAAEKRTSLLSLGKGLGKVQMQIYNS